MSGDVDDNALEAWRDEIYRRLQQIDSGAARMIPWDDARRDLRTRLQSYAENVQDYTSR